MENLTEEYWNNRYKDSNTPWDPGIPTTPIKEYLQSIEDKSSKILFPGAGYGHEAIYALREGFNNVYICDWSTEALNYIKHREPIMDEKQLLNMDFFELQGKYDYIIEQTFYCALPPDKRNDYALKASNLLSENGKLAGVLFASKFNHDGPPFGSNKDEYLEIFQPYFKILKLEECYNSLPSRKGNELFLIAQPKEDISEENY